MHARLHRQGAIRRASISPLAVGAEVKKNILGHVVLTWSGMKKALEGSGVTGHKGLFFFCGIKR